MKKFLKKIHRFRELEKKQSVGFSPREEAALLRLHRLSPGNKLVSNICSEIKKRYFFCKTETFQRYSYVAPNTDTALITNLLLCGNEQLILHFRTAAEWNMFLKILCEEEQNYHHEKAFIDNIPASADYFFEEDVYIAGKYTWIFNEERAKNEIRRFRPSAKLLSCAQMLGQDAVVETYRNLEEMTQTVWHRIFKKELVL